MSLGQHQRVAAGERADVEDREIAAVLVDPDGRSLPAMIAQNTQGMSLRYWTSRRPPK